MASSERLIRNLNDEWWMMNGEWWIVNWTAHSQPELYLQPSSKNGKAQMASSEQFSRNFNRNLQWLMRKNPHKWQVLI